MSLVGSLHEPLIKKVVATEHIDEKVQIKKIISKLIKENADLLANVEAVKVDRVALEKEIIKYIDELGVYVNREEFIRNVFNYMFGYGKLQSYLENENVSDIIGVRFDTFYIKENGETKQIDFRFSSDEEFENFCKLIIIRNGGLINENDNHARVSDENLRLRINVSIPPRNVTGSFLSIRKHRLSSYEISELLELKFLDSESSEKIKEIAVGTSRILIVGKGASGKTTLLKAMLNHIGNKQRILICESDTEIYPNSPTMVVQKILKRGNGGNSITLSDLVKDGLTMSLDGYCVGEIVGPEAWDFVKAGYTDHRIFGTIHGLDGKDALFRLCTLVEANNMTEKSIKKIISRSIDYVIYVSEFKLISINSIKRYDHDQDEFMLNEEYRREQYE